MAACFLINIYYFCKLFIKKMNKRKSQFLSKTITFLKSYVELCIWLLAFAVGIRFFETTLLSKINLSFGSKILYNLTGLGYDVSLFLRVSIWIILIFVATSFLNEKITRIVFRLLLSLMLLFSLICIVFFATSGYFLDKVLFNYSFNEIMNIIKSSSKSPFWVYLVVSILPILYFYLSGKRIKINSILLITFIVLTISSFFILNKISFDANQYHIKVNKEHFFWESIGKKQAQAFKENDEETIKAINEFRSYFPEHQFVETEYPFLYHDSCHDVLSPFFNLKPELPNIVFIIVESFGYEYLKNDYQLMPFLDSLSKNSLTWEYCLSVSSRTFGVLPALFGNAPLGKNGFLEQCPNNPQHHSLLKILHQNNYTNNFFYGGWTGFDNMRNYARENNMKYPKKDAWDEDIINKSIETIWGYEDHLMYEQALRKLSKIKSTPRTDVYMTLSTHDPFEYPNSLHYQNIIKDKVQKNKDLSEQQKTEIFNSIIVYGSFAYADWSIQQLIEGYQKRDDFDNTIFIITGDHHSFAKQLGGYSNYHVPLIIYSPMLNTNRNMKGVVSHRDITPTLLSLLKNNYNIKTPEEVTWLNTALDTSLTFNANTFSPLQIIDHTLDGIMYKNYILCENQLEELIDGTPHKINDKNILKQMKRLLFLYQSLDLYIGNNDALIRNYYAHKSKLELGNNED